MFYFLNALYIVAHTIREGIFTMKRHAIYRFLVLTLILLMVCASATAVVLTSSLEPPAPEPSAQPQERETFDFADYCELVEVSPSQALLQWLDAVADMDPGPTFWGLDGKIRFIVAMKDAGYEIDSKWYSELMDDALDTESRTVAADEIIAFHYGDLMLAYDPFLKDDPPKTIKGIPPYPGIIFREAYYKEFPDATKQEFSDARGY